MKPWNYWLSSVPGTMSTVEFQATEQRFKTMVTKVGEGLSGWAVQHGQAVRWANVTHDPVMSKSNPVCIPECISR